MKLLDLLVRLFDQCPDFVEQLFGGLRRRGSVGRHQIQTNRDGAVIGEREVLFVRLGNLDLLEGVLHQHRGRLLIEDDVIDVEREAAPQACGFFTLDRADKIQWRRGAVIDLGEERITGDIEAAVEIAKNDEGVTFCGSPIDPVLENRQWRLSVSSGFSKHRLLR